MSPRPYTSQRIRKHRHSSEDEVDVQVVDTISAILRDSKEPAHLLAAVNAYSKWRAVRAKLEQGDFGSALSDPDDVLPPDARPM